MIMTCTKCGRLYISSKPTCPHVRLQQPEFRGLAIPLTLIGERGYDGAKEQERRNRERAAAMDAARERESQQGSLWGID